ncbi:MAG: cytidine deaminase [Pseudomonadota bacterium]
MAEASRFADLFAAAAKARENAHAPYSNFKVGASLLTRDGNVVAACNVENAAYSQAQCAEASAIGTMVAQYGASIIVEALVIGGEEGDGLLCSPCGGCRQRLREFALLDTPVHICGPEGLRKTMTIDQLLPESFGPNNLDK